MAFKLGMTVDLCMVYYYARAHFDNLYLDARSQRIGRGKKTLVFNYPDN